MLTSSMIFILGQLKARCSDDRGIDVTDSPLIVRGPPSSASARHQQNTHPGTKESLQITLLLLLAYKILEMCTYAAT